MEHQPKAVRLDEDHRQVFNISRRTADGVITQGTVQQTRLLDIPPRVSVVMRTVHGMAGTMVFDVQVAHIYQRRFEVDDLRRALSSSHWYIISRCPRVRIVEESVRVENNIVSLKVAIHRSGDEVHVKPLILDANPFGSVESFTSHIDGSYFVMIVDGQLIHGDAWSLASLFTQVQADVAAQEVLYIGQSFAEGRSNASGRTAQHKTLQKIYEDHSGSVYDVFVSPLELARRMSSTDDHIEDLEPGPDLAMFYEFFAEPAGPIKQRSVDLIEHALIAYFDPHYNQKLRQWDSAAPTKAMRKMREAGFRLLAVNLMGGDGLARYHSQLVTDTFRNHLILHDIPPHPARPRFRGVSTEGISSWRPAAQMVRHGRRLFANLGEYSGVALRVFGDEAPRDRKPPEVTLPVVETAGQRVSQALPRTRVADREIKKRRRQIEQLRRSQSLPERPTYKNGAIKVGKRHDGHDAFWWLYDTTRQISEHGFVLGGGEEAANLLSLIAHEAARSSRFTVMAVRHSLADLIDVLDERAQDRTRRRGAPSRRRPGTVAVVFGVDALIEKAAETATLQRALREGPDLGVSMVLEIGDLDTAVERVGGLVLDVRNQCSTARDGTAKIASARVGLRPPRQTTQGDPEMVTFLLTVQSNDHTLSELVDTFRVNLSFAQAKKAVAIHVDANNLAGRWRRETDAELWIALDGLTAKFWILRRHEDAWALCRVIARVSGKESGSRSEQLAWAEAALQQNYHMTSALPGWQTGPTFTAADNETLYCSVPRAHLTPINRGSVAWRLG